MTISLVLLCFLFAQKIRIKLSDEINFPQSSSVTFNAKTKKLSKTFSYSKDNLHISKKGNNLLLPQEIGNNLASQQFSESINEPIHIGSYTALETIVNRDKLPSNIGFAKPSPDDLEVYKYSFSDNLEIHIGDFVDIEEPYINRRYETKDSAIKVIGESEGAWSEVVQDSFH